MEGIIQTAVIILNLSDIIQNNSNEIYYVFLENAGVTSGGQKLIKVFAITCKNT